jgi:hypothetical protein
MRFTPRTPIASCRRAFAESRRSMCQTPPDRKLMNVQDEDAKSQQCRYGRSQTSRKRQSQFRLSTRSSVGNAVKRSPRKRLAARRVWHARCAQLRSAHDPYGIALVAASLFEGHGCCVRSDFRQNARGCRRSTFRTAKCRVFCAIERRPDQRCESSGAPLVISTRATFQGYRYTRRR